MGLFSAAPSFADDLTWSAGSGVSILNWSAKSTVAGQTGWRLSWKKTTASVYNSVDILSVTTRTANVCMGYTSQEENYQISTLVGATVGNTYTNTWTYTGAIAGPGATCVNPAEPTPKAIAITYNTNGGTGTMANTTTTSTATSTTLRANTFTRANATFVGWNTVANGTGTSYSDLATYQIVPSTPSTVALYAQWTYSISVTAGANGTITTGSSSGPNATSPTTVSASSAQTFYIQANAGYHVVDVIVSGVSKTALSQWTFTAPNTGAIAANQSISATFAINTYDISATQSTGGSISPSGTTTVNEGSSQTYTITPNTGYSIFRVTVDGTSQGAISTYTFSNVLVAHTITATYAIKTYQITVATPTNGTISSATTSVNYGGSLTLTATADYGYHLSDITVDGISQGNSSSSYTFSNVGETHTFAATFAPDTFGITVSAGANGSISPSTSNVNFGTSPSYTISPNAGYAISDVVVDGVSQGAISTYTFSTVSDSHTISATFAIRTFSMTVTSGSGGSISPGTSSSNYGTNKTYTITPRTGYSIANVLVDGSSVGAVTTYTFSNITATHTISASFAITTNRITVTQGANGTISPSSLDVNYGSNQTFTITPNTGYQVASITSTRIGSLGTSSSYTYSNITAADTITATFSKINYTITLIQGSNGTISATKTSVPYGDSSVVTITPSSGYQISKVIVDGVDLGVITSYTFSNVSDAHLITANFSFVPTVNISSFTPLNFGSGDLVTIYTSAPDLVTGVKFNGVSAQSFSVVSGHIVAKAPTSATNGKITLNTLSLNPASTSTASFTFMTTVVTAKTVCTTSTQTTTTNIAMSGCPAIKLPLPIISTFTPSIGSVTARTVITVTGSNFSGITSVKINGKAATFTVSSMSSMQVTVPTGATTGKISVTNSAGTVNSAASLIITA
jgi:hypothetical protein